jgi:DNA-binding CsgD family transcriptional regulator
MPLAPVHDSLRNRWLSAVTKRAEFRYPLDVKNAVLVYGIAGGILIAALRFAEYRFLVVEHSLEIYGGLIALVFAGLGVWLGLTITRTEVVKEEVIVVKEVPAPDPPFAVNEDRQRELAITPRELQILGLVAQGLSAREMAAALFVSENTVKTHTARLFDKLGVNRRIKAVEAGRRFGLIP